MCIGRFCYLLFFLALLLPLESVADEPVSCPETLAVIQDDTLVAVTLEAFKKLYLQLGCSPKLSELPGRRGVVYFNKHLVDGEFFRLSRVEASYTRAFVRSATPLFQLSNSLWLHPDPTVRERYPIGYILGVIWQEQYMKDRDGASFASAIEMFNAYRRGHIAGFLASDNSVTTLVAKGDLLPAPILEKNLLRAPVYHYLGSEHTEFMAKVSELLAQENPFEPASLPGKN
ncbi:MAG: hypothetical protein V7752_15405 [Halopseudomonas sp.]